jgi:spermidine synthase
VFYAYTGQFRYGMLLLIVLIGSLIGLEIPLLTRILRQYGTLRTTLSSVLSMDYFGSLVAALLFPYLLLPFLGAMYTSILTGLVNWAVGVFVFVIFRHQLGRNAGRWLAGLAALSGTFLVALLVLAQPLLDRWESNFYEDPVVYEEQSPYQKIVLTSRGEHIRLYLNGHLQFASVDEYRYHEALVHPAMALSASRQRVLIIGGGDGLTAREVLKYDDVESVELVDLDPAITRLARRNLYLTRLNDNALNRQRLTVINLDGFLFLQAEHAPYGVIIIDLPDPREEGLAKLYSLESYRLALRLLAPGGIIVTQATSPYFAREAFWCIGQTMEEAGLQVISYHLNVPSFGEWGFHLGALRPLEAERARFDVSRQYLDESTWLAALVFGRDIARVPTQINELDKPALARYYRRGWNEWF